MAIHKAYTPKFEHSEEYVEFLGSIGVTSANVYRTNINSAARAAGRNLLVSDASSETAVARTMRLIAADAVAKASRRSICTALRKYAAMVETNFRRLFSDGPVRPAHLPEFEEWLVSNAGNAKATANLYGRFLSRCAEHYEICIHPRTLAYDLQVERILDNLNRVVSRHGRWKEGTFNEHDVADNLTPALRAYVKFAKSEYPERGEPVMRANDVPSGRIPERVLQEITRLVRDPILVQKIKALHEYTCQLCGLQMALPKGEYYAEGQHLKTLGSPPN